MADNEAFVQEDIEFELQLTRREAMHILLLVHSSYGTYGEMGKSLRNIAAALRDVDGQLFEEQLAIYLKNRQTFELHGV